MSLMEQWDLVSHKFLNQPWVMYETLHGITLEDLLAGEDPDTWFRPVRAQAHMHLVLDDKKEPLPTLAICKTTRPPRPLFTSVAELFMPRPVLHMMPTVPAQCVYQMQCPPQCELPVIFDSGASCGLSPVRSDFVGDLQPPDVEEMKGIGASIKTVGKGTVEWPIVDLQG